MNQKKISTYSIFFFFLVSFSYAKLFFYPNEIGKSIELGIVFNYLPPNIVFVKSNQIIAAQTNFIISNGSILCIFDDYLKTNIAVRKNDIIISSVKASKGIKHFNISPNKEKVLFDNGFNIVMYSVYKNSFVNILIKDDFDSIVSFWSPNSKQVIILYKDNQEKYHLNVWDVFNNKMIKKVFTSQIDTVYWLNNESFIVSYVIYDEKKYHIIENRMELYEIKNETDIVFKKLFYNKNSDGLISRIKIFNEKVYFLYNSFNDNLYPDVYSEIFYLTPFNGEVKAIVSNLKNCTDFFVLSNDLVVFNENIYKPGKQQGFVKIFKKNNIVNWIENELPISSFIFY